VERVALTDAKNHMRARKAVRRALQNQVEGRGFSFVEVLSACPTGWKAEPPEAIQWVEKNMTPVFPVRVFKDRAESEDHEAQAPQRSAQIYDFRDHAVAPPAENTGAIARKETPAAAIKVSGFGGQGVLFCGVALAEAGMREGLQVSWIPSYGPEMRGGTAHCHVRLSTESIASPLISKPTAVIAFNQPSAERFAPELIPGGLLMLNSSMVRTSPERSDVRTLWIPATEKANALGSPKVGNMVMLGAYLQATGAVHEESIFSALREHGFRADVIEANARALKAGRELVSAAS
jgi:2-oxoisovalerate ferredoxin oxidoreductase beta subunit